MKEKHPEFFFMPPKDNDKSKKIRRQGLGLKKEKSISKKETLVQAIIIMTNNEKNPYSAFIYNNEDELEKIKEKGNLIVKEYKEKVSVNFLQKKTAELNKKYEKYLKDRIA